jgi:hypothetical protein
VLWVFRQTKRFRLRGSVLTTALKANICLIGPELRLREACRVFGREAPHRTATTTALLQLPKEGALSRGGFSRRA